MRWLRDLPLLSKLLLPNVLLLLAVGGVGTFVLVRDVAERARATVDADLAQRSAAARTYAQERQLYVLEAATYAANVQGMAAALEDRDAPAATRLLRSVRTLKGDLAGLAAYDLAAESVGREGSVPAGAAPLVQQGLSGPPAPRGALVGDAFVLVLPVCGTGDGCRRTGVVLAALPAAGLLPEAPGASLSLFASDGRLAARRGPVAVQDGPVPDGAQVRTRDGDAEVLLSRLPLQGGGTARLAASVDGQRVAAAVRGDAQRLGAVVLAGVLGVIGVALLLSRLLVGDVSRLLDVVRRIGRGDLQARAEAPGTDELGELARGVNAMGEQLQADVVTLEARVAERTAEVERLLRQRSELFAALSHEFRTPLAVVRAEVSLLLDDKGLQRRPAVREALETVAESSTQVLALVNDVLDLARTEAGRLELRPAPVEVGELVAPVARTLRGLAAAADVAVDVHVAPDLPGLVVDVQRVRQVLLNLVSNAVRYGGAHVTLAAERSPVGVQVVVTDDGAGIPAAYADRVYEAFVRVPGQRPRDGGATSGLGLALSRGLAEASGGSLTHSSRPGRTAFVLELPGLPQQAVRTQPVQRLETAADLQR